MMRFSVLTRFFLIHLALLIIPLSHAAGITEKTPSNDEPRGFEDAVKDLVHQWDKDHVTTPSRHVEHVPEKLGKKDVQTNKDVAEGERPPQPVTNNDVDDVAEPGHSYPVEAPKTDGRNCTRCLPHEEARQMRLAVIKAQILDKLRLSHPPNITRKMMLKIPPVNEILSNLNPGSSMMSDSPYDDAYAHQLREYEDDDEYHLNTQKVISLAQNPPKSFAIEKERGYVYFNFAKNILNHRVAKAVLWVKVNSNRVFGKYAPARLYVYQVHKTDDKQNPTALHRFTQMEVHSGTTEDGWVILDVRKLVAHWFRNPKSNLGMVIHLKDPEEEYLKVFSPEDQENLPVPFIEVMVEPKKHTRRKRSLGMTCPENSKEVKCCRYPLTVDFEKFGWDWVIAPKRYEANYCSGECPYVFLQSYTHTHLVTQVNPQGSTGPCCAAKRLSPISMLYFDTQQNNIVLGTLPNMVVEECGCN